MPRPKPHESVVHVLEAEITRRASHPGRLAPGDLRRTTIALPRNSLRELKRVAIDADLPLNAVLLAGVDALLRQAGREPVAGLEMRLEDVLKALGVSPTQ